MANAITTAADAMRPGDILVLEVQTDGPATGNRWPFTIVMLDNVASNSVLSNDWIY